MAVKSSLFLGLLALFMWSGTVVVEAEKSLFDTLPLNGALPGEPVPVKQSEKPALKVVPKKTSNGTTPSSLFDLLPNQGALKGSHSDAEGPKPSSNSEDTDSEVIQRPSRDSSPQYLRPPTRQEFADFDVEHQPSTELDLSFFKSNLLSPIVKSLTREASTEYGAPVSASIPVLNRDDGGYGGAQPVRQKFATRNPTSKEVTSGSTVIVYASGNAPSKSGETSQQYGAPSKSEPPKNEVHYHYHINRDAEKSTEPSVGYSSPSRGYKGPPRNTYLAPQEPSGGYAGTQSGGRQPIALEQPVTTEFPILGPNNPSKDEFRDRTLFSAATQSIRYGPPPPPPPRQVYGAPPSQNYGTPPSQDYGAPPSQNYGAPPPPQDYVPPPPLQSNPPFLPSNQQQPPQSLTQTSITLETIPVTTTHTRLVTVPKITQTIGSTNPIPPQFDEEQPSGGYPDSGAPSSPIRTRTSRVRENNNPRVLLNEQLAQLSPREVGIGDISEADLLAALSSTDALGQRNAADVRLTLAGSTGLRNQDLVSLGGSTGLRNQDLLSPALSSGYNLGSLRGGPTVLTGDAVGAVSDIIREQKLQQAVTDLRYRLRSQNRESERTRQLYRNLFYKGALLLGGLSLFPAVASVTNSGGAAIASSLLPLAGRRKRSTDTKELQDCTNLPEIKLPASSKGGGYMALKRKKCRRRSKTADNRSLFGELPFHGAMVPADVRPEEILPVDYVVRNSRCFQKHVCLLLQTHRGEHPLPGNVPLNTLPSSEGKNRWLQEALTAAKQGQCDAFYCYTP